MSDADIVIRVRSDGIQNAESALNRLRDVGVQTETVTNRMVEAQNRANQQMTASRMLMQSMMAVGIVSFVGAGTVAIARQADAWTNLSNKLANANSANERAIDVQNRVFDIAQRTRASLDATGTLYARMERSLNSYGATAQQVSRITETINKAMVVSGATAEEATAAIIQLSQGLQSGTLRGDEFRSVAEQAPRLLQAMANSLNKTTGELRALAGQGKLTGDVVAEAIFKASDAIDQEFSKTSATFSQKLVMAQNNLVKFAGTNATTAGATGLLGDAIVGVSQHIEELAAVAGFLAVTYTGRVITAMIATRAASLQSAISTAQETAAATALTSARVQGAAADLQAAQAKLVAVSAERQLIIAAVQSEQQMYKGVVATNAMMYNTRAAAIATAEVTAAQTALQAAISATITRQTALNVVMTIGKGIMSLLGGPVGIIMLAASAWYMYSQSQDQAIEKARQLAVDTDTLKDRLAKMTEAQQRALEVELRRSQVTLTDKLREENLELRTLQNRLADSTRAMKQAEEGSWWYRDAVKSVKELQDEIIVQQGKVSTTQQQLGEGRENLRTITENLAAGERGLRAAVLDTNSAMGLAQRAATERSDALTKALQAQNAEADVARLKLAGHERQAAQLQDVQNRMPKVYAANKKFVDDYINGHIEAGKALGVEQQGIVEFIKQSGAAYDAQKKLIEQRKEDRATDRKNRAAIGYQEQWDKAYERTEARGATALDRLRIQQESEIRIIENKAAKAHATSEQLNNALNAIEEKYARQRADIAGQYAPGRKIAKDYETALKTIQQLQRDELLNTQETAQARLDAEANYLNQRVELIKADAVTRRELMIGEYDPIQAAQNTYDQQLAILDFYHEQSLISEQNYIQKRQQLITKLNEDQIAAQYQTQLTYIKGASSIAAGMAGILETMGAKNSAAYKVMFAASKAFAIADATVKIQQGIANASILPFPANLAAIGTVISATSSILSTITSTNMKGFRTGGWTGGGGVNDIAGVVHGQEYVFDAASTARIGRDNLEAMRRGRSVGTGANVTVIVHNNLGPATVRKEVTQDDDNVKVELFIDQAAKQIATQVKQGYGPVTEALESTYDVRRK